MADRCREPRIRDRRILVGSVSREGRPASSFATKAAVFRTTLFPRGLHGRPLCQR